MHLSGTDVAVQRFFQPGVSLNGPTTPAPDKVETFLFLRSVRPLFFSSLIRVETAVCAVKHMLHDSANNSTETKMLAFLGSPVR